MTQQQQSAAWRATVQDVNSYFLIALGFALPFSVAIDGVLAGLILLLLLIGGCSRESFSAVKSNRVVWAVAGFYLLHIVGMLWTEDVSIGIRTLKKEALLLYLPVFMLVAKNNHRRYYLLAYLLAMTVQVLLSYAIWFRVIPPFNIATMSDPVPFMGHITYNPFLAIATYFLLYHSLFNNSTGKGLKGLLVLLTVAFSINMFITQGRAGQLVYFVMLAVLIFQYYSRYAIRAAFVAAIAVILAFICMYQWNGSFRERMDQVAGDVRNYDTHKGSAVGARISFALNSFEIIKRNPIIGVGTGDFNMEYAKVDAQTTKLGGTTNPHNMYTLEAVQFGALGVISLVSILGGQLYEANRSGDPLGRQFGMVLPIMFGVMMLSDSYLRGFFSSMLFVYLSSFTYRNWNAGKGRQDA